MLPEIMEQLKLEELPPEYARQTASEPVPASIYYISV
jgi:hypothetical protein